MKNILLIHPDSNINNNPNLFAMAELFSDNGYYIDIIVKKIETINQISYINNLKFIFFNSKIDYSKQINIKKYDLVIGIDDGIILASKISKQSNIPCGFISYEIMFADEIKKENKKNEIEACNNISFAICQDQVRSYFLSREYNIPIDKILNIPVSGNFDKKYLKSYFLYDHLNIPKNKKIVLFAGSVCKWSMIEEIVIQSDSWSDEWVLVLHDRYGRESKSLSKLISNRPRVFISSNQISTPHDLEKLICSADVGIGLYQSNFDVSTDGKNLTFIGLSSGKLMTYLKCGVPVITNEIGQISDIIRENKLGLVVSSIREIDPGKIENVTDCRDKCAKYFEEHLSFDRKASQILELISDTISLNNVDTKKITHFNSDSDSSYSLSNIKQVEYYFNLAKNIENSKFYKLGYFLYNPFFPIKKILYAVFNILLEKYILIYGHFFKTVKSMKIKKSINDDKTTKYNFCTLFDRNYIFKGLALYYSMLDHCNNFELWILCMDDETYAILEKMKLKYIKLLKLKEIEDPDLLSIKHTRTPGEYCWTMTPTLPLYILKNNPSLKSITYLDADSAFFNDPRPIFEELGNDSILITEHRFRDNVEQRIRENGKYNVHFLIFKNDGNSIECLKWWREQCLKWCFNRHENGLIGDQAYLNDWVARFKGVHELQHIGGGLAPWNIFNYVIRKKGKNVFVDDMQLVAYHYHAFRIYSENLFQYVTGYMSKLTKNEKELIYDPYVVYIKNAIKEVKNIDPEFNYGFEKKELKAMLAIFLTGIKRNLNI